MSKKDYERAATIAQGYGDLARREAVVDAFVTMFRAFPRFDVDRFRRTCLPGANVKARG